MANSFGAGPERINQRWALRPVGSRLLIARYTHLERFLLARRTRRRRTSLKCWSVPTTNAAHPAFWGESQCWGRTLLRVSKPLSEPLLAVVALLEAAGNVAVDGGFLNSPAGW